MTTLVNHLGIDGYLDEQAVEPRRRSAVRARARTLAWPGVMAFLLVATGMAFTLLWGPVVSHRSFWQTPGDIWGMFRAAHFVGWGDIGDVYTSQTGLVTMPLVAVVLAPVAMLSGHLGLSESLPYFLPHPAAWLLLGPAELSIGASVLFPLDALARYLRIPSGRRVALCVVETVVLWPVVAIWGHPEDALAMTFALYGLLAAFEGRWKRCGWLWGLALAAQPLVVLALPLVFALAPVRRWVGLVVKSAIPAVALVAIPLAQEWRQTATALFKQPNYPSIDHATPWVALAPVLSPAHIGVTRRFGQVVSGHRTFFTTDLVTGEVGKVVAAGPGRLVAIVLAVAVGVWAYRVRPSPAGIVWCVAVALSLRCVFESVMDPYYVWPPLAVALLIGASARWPRFIGAALIAGAVTVYAYVHTGPWLYWGPLVVMLAVIIVLVKPRVLRRGSDGDDRQVAHRDEVAGFAVGGHQVHEALT